jgi:hypothetical protein
MSAISISVSLLIALFTILLLYRIRNPKPTDPRFRITKDVPVLRVGHIPTKGMLLGVWQVSYSGDLDSREIERRLSPQSEALIVRNQNHERWRRCRMLVAENMVGLSWVSVRDRLPFDGHECALIYRNPKSNDLGRAIGCRLHGNWEIQGHTLVNCDVRAWLRLPSTPSNI